VRASQRAGTKLVDITYDVAATGAVSVAVAVSTNGGATYDLPATHFSGHYGAGVTPGTGKAIVWDAGADWDGQYSAAMRVKVTADDGSNPQLPPDPATVATPVSNGVVTLIGQSTAFLYTGTNPIQTGVAAGTMNELRVAVLKGQVLAQDGNALSGVKVTVEGHAEYGQTLTRTNGCYDLAVNGGGSLNINYTKSGYLPVQRTVDVPWQDYVSRDTVVMLPADTNVTVLSLGGGSAMRAGDEMLVARGGQVSDADGTRRALVMLPNNVQASIITTAGETQQVNSLTTRFTEYTVGSNGPAAMPGDLPSAVAYTYCVELGTDEAQAKSAGRDILFNTNVYFYVENVLGISAGVNVPSGYYDKERGAWVPAPDGMVIQLLGTNAEGDIGVTSRQSTIEDKNV
jgi:hypothetical protein